LKFLILFENILFTIKLKVKWDHEHGISKKTHGEYLIEFGTRFYESVKKLIDINATQSHFLDNFQFTERHLIQEVIDHANFCLELIEKFHGRNDLIEQV
jgi:hypothetical protein